MKIPPLRAIRSLQPGGICRLWELHLPQLSCPEIEDAVYGVSPPTYNVASGREEQLLCEIAENEKRKEFTPSERIAYGLELEQIERLIVGLI